MGCIARRLCKADADPACKNPPITSIFRLGNGSVIIDGEEQARQAQSQESANSFARD